MIPFFSRHYQMNGRSASFENFSKFIGIEIMRIWLIKATNFKDLFIGIFRKWMSFAFSIAYAMSSFLSHILHIITSCSYEKMFRIYASRIVALMTDKHSFWNFTKRQFPRNSLGMVGPSFPSEHPIATTFTTYPNPTSFSFFDIRPERFWGSSSHEFIIHQCV